MFAVMSLAFWIQKFKYSDSILYMAMFPMQALIINSDLLLESDFLLLFRSPFFKCGLHADCDVNSSHSCVLVGH